ncbi:hypothetical protein ACTXNU_16110, partial [Pseudomonas helleri]
MNNDQDYLQRAVELARINVDEGGRPFGAVLVKDGQVIVERAKARFLSVSVLFQCAEKFNENSMFLGFFVFQRFSQYPC